MAVLVRGLSRNALLLGLLGLGFLLVLPLPTPLLSLLLVLDLAVSGLVLATLVRASDTGGVTTLPTILLLGALFRLALNIASSRLILSQGDAGVVVESVGRLLTNGHWAVGLLMYGMVSLVQWMVINQGSGRVAEVAARFALDAIPVRMLALDQEAKSGRLDSSEVERRRTRLLDEASWHGAMDGAIRFVRGDALVGLVIAAINLIAGTMLGALRDGQTFSVAIDTYATLAIGDGLVSQIPSLLLSIGAAIAVTRVGNEGVAGGLSTRIVDEFASAPRQLLAAGIWIAAFSLIPELPAWPFVSVGGGIGLLGALGIRGGWGPRPPTDAEPARLLLPRQTASDGQGVRISEHRLAERVRLRWGTAPPPVRVERGDGMGGAAILIWCGAEVTRWTPVAASDDALMEEIVERTAVLCARALTTSSVKALLLSGGHELPNGVSLPLATQALRICLSEGISVARVARIAAAWETSTPGASARQLAELAREVSHTEQVVAYAREGSLNAILVTPSVEQELRTSLKLGAVTEDGELPQAIREAVEEAVAGVTAEPGAAFVVSQDVRWLFAPIAAKHFPALPVFGHREVRQAGMKLAVIGRVISR